jgi:hypothetical protein
LLNSFFVIDIALLSSVQPVEITFNPPPAWTAGNEIPMNRENVCPDEVRSNQEKKQFIAIRNDSARRVLDEYCLVIAGNMGLPPSGSTIGNNALRSRNKLFAASVMRFLPVIRAQSCPGGNGHCRNSGKKIPAV